MECALARATPNALCIVVARTSIDSRRSSAERAAERPNASTSARNSAEQKLLARAGEGRAALGIPVG
jgi:hypothetical protein